MIKFANFMLLGKLESQKQ
jgi:hypothetical protein